MKIWTQDEFERVKTAGTGHVELGTGDFSHVLFRGAHNLVIGPNSRLGAHAHLGMNCEIGSRCAVGDGFAADGTLAIGEHCNFGTDAMLGEAARIGRGCSFASRVEIAEGTQIADGVSLPMTCKLFGVPNADGRTLMKLTVNGAQLVAFAAQHRWALEPKVWVCTAQASRELDEFQRWAADLGTMQGMTSSMEQVREGLQLVAAGAYIRARFSLMGLCDARRREA